MRRNKLAEAQPQISKSIRSNLSSNEAEADPAARAKEGEPGRVVGRFKWPLLKAAPLPANSSLTAQVVVLGADPAGLTLALLLARQGLQVTVLDDRRSFAGSSAEATWGAETLELLAYCGLGSQLLEVALPRRRQQILLSSFGGAPARLASQTEVERIPDRWASAPAFHLQQYRMERLLVEALSSFPSSQVDVRFQTKVDEVLVDRDGVRLWMTTPGEEAPVKCDLVADYMVICTSSSKPEGGRFDSEPLRTQGAHTAPAAARTVLSVDVEVHSESDRRAIPADRRLYLLHGQEEQDGTMFVTGSSSGERRTGTWVALYQRTQPDKLVRFDAEMQAGIKLDRPVQKRAAEELTRTVLGHERFTVVSWVAHQYQPEAAPVFSDQNRVFLCGEALMSLSPFGGAAGNYAVQDASNLAWKLVAVLQYGASPDLLDTYQAEREVAYEGTLERQAHAEEVRAPSMSLWCEMQHAALALLNGGHKMGTALWSFCCNSEGPSSCCSSPILTQDGSTPGVAFHSKVPCPGEFFADCSVEDMQPRVNFDEAASSSSNGFLLHHLGMNFTLIVFVLSEQDIPWETLRRFNSAPSNLNLSLVQKVVILLDVSSLERRSDQFKEVLKDAGNSQLTLLGDRSGVAARAYDARPGTTILVRPDLRVGARWRQFQPKVVQEALLCAIGCSVESKDTPRRKPDSAKPTLRIDELVEGWTEALAMVPSKQRLVTASIAALLLACQSTDWDAAMKVFNTAARAVQAELIPQISKDGGHGHGNVLKVMPKLALPLQATGNKKQAHSASVLPMHIRGSEALLIENGDLGGIQSLRLTPTSGTSSLPASQPRLSVPDVPGPAPGVASGAASLDAAVGALQAALQAEPYGALSDLPPQQGLPILRQRIADQLAEAEGVPVSPTHVVLVEGSAAVLQGLLPALLSQVEPSGDGVGLQRADPPAEPGLESGSPGEILLVGGCPSSWAPVLSQHRVRRFDQPIGIGGGAADAAAVRAEQVVAQIAVDTCVVLLPLFSLVTGLPPHDLADLGRFVDFELRRRRAAAAPAAGPPEAFYPLTLVVDVTLRGWQLDTPPVVPPGGLRVLAACRHSIVVGELLGEWSAAPGLRAQYAATAQEEHRLLEALRHAPREARNASGASMVPLLQKLAEVLPVEPGNLEELRRRRDAMCDALASASMRVGGARPRAGHVLCAELPEGVDEAGFCQVLAGHGVYADAGSQIGAAGCVRLSFAQQGPWTESRQFFAEVVRTVWAGHGSRSIATQGEEISIQASVSVEDAQVQVERDKSGLAAKVAEAAAGAQVSAEESSREVEKLKGMLLKSYLQQAELEKEVELRKRMFLEVHIARGAAERELQLVKELLRDRAVGVNADRDRASGAPAAGGEVALEGELRRLRTQHAELLREKSSKDVSLDEMLLTSSVAKGSELEKEEIQRVQSLYEDALRDKEAQAARRLLRPSGIITGSELEKELERLRAQLTDAPEEKQAAAPTSAEVQQLKELLQNGSDPRREGLKEGVELLRRLLQEASAAGEAAHDRELEELRRVLLQGKGGGGADGREKELETAQVELRRELEELRARHAGALEEVGRLEAAARVPQVERLQDERLGNVPEEGSASVKELQRELEELRAKHAGALQEVKRLEAAAPASQEVERELEELKTKYSGALQDLKRLEAAAPASQAAALTPGSQAGSPTAGGRARQAMLRSRPAQADAAPLAAQLLGGARALACVAQLSSCIGPQLLAEAGFHVLLIDHAGSPLDAEAVERIVRASLGAGAHPVLRMALMDLSLAARAVEAGAEGLLLPGVTTTWQAEAFASLAAEAVQLVRGGRPEREDGEDGGGGGGSAPAVRRPLVAVEVDASASLDLAEALMDVGGVDLVLLRSEHLHHLNAASSTSDTGGGGLQLQQGASEAEAAAGIGRSPQTVRPRTPRAALGGAPRENTVFSPLSTRSDKGSFRPVPPASEPPTGRVRSAVHKRDAAALTKKRWEALPQVAAAKGRLIGSYGQPRQSQELFQAGHSLVVVGVDADLLEQRARRHTTEAKSGKRQPVPPLEVARARFASGALVCQLRLQKKALAAFLHLNDPAAVELVSLTGFEAVVVDHEQGLGGLSRARNLIHAAAGVGAHPLVRAPGIDDAYLRQVLQLGISGLIVPTVESAAQAKQFVECVRRCWPTGMSLRVALAANAQHLPGRGEDLLLKVCQIETQCGLDAAGDIAQVEGIDMVFFSSPSIGPWNEAGLMLALGEAEMEVKKAGRLLGGYLVPGRSAEQMYAAGYDLVCTTSDAALLRAAADGVVGEAQMMPGYASYSPRAGGKALNPAATGPQPARTQAPEVPLVAWMKNGQGALGVIAHLESAPSAEIAARAGFHTIVMDTCRGPAGANLFGVVNLTNAARVAGAHAIIRASAKDHNTLRRARLTGVEGIIVSHVGSTDEAQQAADLFLGRTSEARSKQRQADTCYVTAVSEPDYILRASELFRRQREANAKAPFVAIEVTSRQSGLPMEDLVGVRGIDMIFVGSPGLSGSELSRLEMGARKAGRLLGGQLPLGTSAADMFKAGYMLVCLASDRLLLAEGAASCVQALRS